MVDDAARAALRRRIRAALHEAEVLRLAAKGSELEARIDLTAAQLARIERFFLMGPPPVTPQAEARWLGVAGTLLQVYCAELRHHQHRVSTQIPALGTRRAG